MQFERKTFEAQPYVYVEKTCDYSEIGQAMGEAFGAVFGFFGEKGITPLSAPMSLYTAMPDGPKLTFRAGAMVSAEDAAKADGEITADEIPAGDALHTIHVGPYASLSKSHGALWKHIETQGIEPKMPVWEIYVDDPDDTDEEILRTEIYRALA